MLLLRFKTPAGVVGVSMPMYPSVEGRSEMKSPPFKSAEAVALDI